MRYDSLLNASLNAGQFFFAAWSVVVAVVSLVAFGPDIFPKARFQPKAQQGNSARPANPRLH